MFISIAARSEVNVDFAKPKYLQLQKLLQQIVYTFLDPLLHSTSEPCVKRRFCRTHLRSSHISSVVGSTTMSEQNLIKIKIRPLDSEVTTDIHAQGHFKLY